MVRGALDAKPASFSRARLAPTLLLVALLAACGGGGGAGGSGIGSGDPAACSLDSQKVQLRASLDSEYLWYSQLQSPDPAAFGTLSDYLGALLSPGVPGNAAFPRDRWSGLQTTEAFQRLFGDGQSLGFGLAVAGREVARTTQPLRVRSVEPRSPAARAGVVRGDTIERVNGQPAAALTAADNFDWLVTDQVGAPLELQLRDTAGALRTVNLRAEVYDLQPVPTATVLRSPAGRRVGYVVLSDFISQSTAPLDAAFAQFRAAAVQELVVDLRYNGGGLVQLAADLASRIRPQASGQAFSRLVYSDRQADRNLTFAFNSQPQALGGLSRVYVLTGVRTCSASELLINGLKPFVDVVQLGGTTCGKPVGFQPRDNGCGSTVSQVNFESVNANGEGRYWDGIAARCEVAEDWNRPLGDPSERLTAAALTHADTGACPAVSAGDALRVRSLQARLREGAPGGSVEPGERRGMWVP